MRKFNWEGISRNEFRRFPDIRVYLDGKTETGATVYKNEDMSAHAHKSKQQQQPPKYQYQEQGSTTIVTPATKEDRILALLNGLNIKIDRVVAAQEKIGELVEIMKQFAAPVSKDNDDEASS
jgi:hypothetical protein